MISLIKTLLELIIILLLGTTLFIAGAMAVYWIAEVITGLSDKEK